MRNNSFPSRFFSLLALTAALFAVTACANRSQQWQSPASSWSPSYIQLSSLAPPPPPAVQEPVPQIGNPRTQIWRPGYWDYSNLSFSWVPGEIITRPSATAVWAPDHWIKHTYGWAFVPGYWQ